MIEPDKFLGYLIRSSGRAFANNVNKKIKDRGLNVTIEHVGLMFKISHVPGSSQQELSSYFFKDKTTIARVLTTMEKNNMVLRVPSDKDKRTNLLYLTNKGKEVLQELSEAAKEVVVIATEGVDEEELEVCKKVLNKIRINLEGDIDTSC
jgi:DNA-binding MarR family transcriptional regulator